MHPKRIPQIARYLMRDEAISGKVILIATALALLLANTGLFHFYNDFWHINFSVGFSNFAISQDLRHWVNEGLMTFFFLVIGLEIKRELVHGGLRQPKKALLPIVAAFGGMIVPALFYIALNPSGPGFDGWAIPIATDIAFALGILALIGRGIPSALKLFLLTLAIVDDIAAVVVIAIFYGTGFNIAAFGIAILLSAVLLYLAHTKRLNLTLVIIIGTALWIAINASGIHASITGALLGLLIPASKKAFGLSDRIERYIIPVTTLAVVPLFAFANTGVKLTISGFEAPASSVAAGILLGLVVGKVTGIFGATWIMTRFFGASLPKGSSWRQILGIGFIAGIGFTVSIFVTDLAFISNESLENAAKLSIFVASAVSGIIGLLLLRTAPRT